MPSLYPSAIAAIDDGLIVAALSLMTVVSIAGRWASSLPMIGDMTAFGWVSPVTSDYEMAQMGTLPYCHLRSGHVTVDLLIDLAQQQWTPR